MSLAVSTILWWENSSEFVIFLQLRCKCTLFNFMKFFFFFVPLGRDSPEFLQIGIIQEKVENLFQQFLREMCKKPSITTVGMQ